MAGTGHGYPRKLAAYGGTGDWPGGGTGQNGDALDGHCRAGKGHVPKFDAEGGDEGRKAGPGDGNPKKDRQPEPAAEDC